MISRSGRGKDGGDRGQALEDRVEGKVVVAAPLSHVLHVRIPRDVEGVWKCILRPVEVEHLDPEALARWSAGSAVVGAGAGDNAGVGEHLLHEAGHLVAVGVDEPRGICEELMVIPALAGVRWLLRWLLRW